MKALLYSIIVILILYISYVICESNKYAVKNFPKKVKPYGNGKILINSGKYEYKSKVPKGTPTSQPPPSSKRSYTVFQVVGNSKTIQGVPDSPYFPVDQSYDHKPRVKKVLPDYVWGSGVRNKRAAVTDDTANKDTPDDPTTIVTTTTAKSETKKPKAQTTPQITSATNTDDDLASRKSKSSPKGHAKPTTETEADEELGRKGVTKVAKNGKDDEKDKSKDVNKPKLRADELNESTTATTVQAQPTSTTQLTTVTSATMKKNETKPQRVHKKKKGKTGTKVNRAKKARHGKRRPKRLHKRKVKRGSKGHKGAGKGKNHGRSKKHPKVKSRQRSKSKKGRKIVKLVTGNRTMRASKGKAITDKKV
ncbi:unnamed protein product [Chrysodeixis includens]|uniref:Uncharacterized protein n=1 Tax=Chrysodeixis includens TaxID=689277 RepID=A0A9N8KY36_CHRIL|nr:unnamed protein product [Chrysodeixis includens]